MGGEISLRENFDKFSNNIAVIHKGKRYSYADLDEAIDRFGQKLREKSIDRGDVVAIRSDYSFDAIALFFALAENGNIIVPITSESEEEVQKRLDIASVGSVFKHVDGIFEVEKYDATESENGLIQTLANRGHAGLVLFSSGSTGEPKAMLHDLDILMQSYTSRKSKILNTLLFLTFDHIGGIDTMLRSLSIGGTLTIPEGRNPEAVCKAVESEKVDVLPVSPTFINLLLLSRLHKDYDLGSLKIIAFGAEPMPKPLLERVKRSFPDAKLQQKFGTSETNAVKIRNDQKNPLFFKIEDPNVKYRIVDGELWLKSGTQAVGYLNTTTESFTEDGWFKTGDIVEEDADGFIRVVGRNKEIINVGGEKVFPAEVENVLYEMPEIADAMVYGEANIITGQGVTADIVPNGVYDKREMKKMVRRFCKERLEGYKIPSRVNIVESLNFTERFKKIRRRK